MAHHQTVVADEQFEFRSETRNKLFMLLGVGILLFVAGIFFAMRSGGAKEGHGEGGHAAVETHKLVASTDQQPQVGDNKEVTEDHHAEAAEGHDEGKAWLKRIKSSLWMNNIFFTGLGIIGLFFIAIQYA